MIKDSKTILGSINSIVAATGPSSSQEVLGKAYREFADLVEKTAKETKDIASLLGDLLSQQDVLTASKATAIASQAFIIASKEAMTRPDDGDAQKDLREKSVSVTNAINELIR